MGKNRDKIDDEFLKTFNEAGLNQALEFDENRTEMELKEFFDSEKSELMKKREYINSALSSLEEFEKSGRVTSKDTLFNLRSQFLIEWMRLHKSFLNQEPPEEVSVKMKNLADLVHALDSLVNEGVDKDAKLFDVVKELNEHWKNLIDLEK